MVRKFLDERITHMVNRPEMWASTAEALEGMVMQLLWVRDNTDYYNELQKFYHDMIPGMTRSSPIWAQKVMSVTEIAELLKLFITRLPEHPPRMNKLDLIKDESKKLTLRDFERNLGEMVVDFASDFDRGGVSDFMKGEHTFFEWMNSFGNWLSF